MTLAAVREKLKGAKGKRYWRSVDELANTPEFQAAVEKEFPSVGAGVGRSGLAARLLEAHGRVDGAGRAWPDAPSSPMSRFIPTSKRRRI